MRLLHNYVSFLDYVGFLLKSGIRFSLTAPAYKYSQSKQNIAYKRLQTLNNYIQNGKLANFVDKFSWRTQISWY